MQLCRVLDQVPPPWAVPQALLYPAPSLRPLPLVAGVAALQQLVHAPAVAQGEWQLVGVCLVVLLLAVAALQVQQAVVGPL